MNKFAIQMKLGNTLFTFVECMMWLAGDLDACSADGGWHTPKTFKTQDGAEAFIKSYDLQTAYIVEVSSDQ